MPSIDEASVVVAVGTTRDHLVSSWVRYEWDGFFNDILSGTKPDGRVFTYVEGLQLTQLPRALRQTQPFLHSPPDSLQRLYNFIKVGLRADEETGATVAKTETLPSLPDPSPPPRLETVFISYDRADEKVATRIFDALQEKGISVWFDRKAGLIPGDLFENQVRNAMNNAALVIPIISENTESRREAWFIREWNLASERMAGFAPGRAFILPVIVGDLRQPQNVPPSFKHLIHMRMRQDVPEELIERVVMILERFERG